MNRLKNRITNLIKPLVLLVTLSAIPQFAAAAYSAKAHKLLAQVRAETAKYHNEAVAIAAGYVPDAVCVPGMGYHYINGSLVGAPGVTERQPEVLLYVDSPNGGRRLVGVEYLAFAMTAAGPWVGPNPPDFISTNPILFDGQALNGPMIGHAPDMPWHYDLHVWIWSHNPDGMFATFNPNVTCN